MAKVEGKTAEKVAAMAPPAIDELEGITIKDCPILCTLERCTITQRPLCAHPHKGGVQSAFMMDADILERYRQARIRLAQQKLKEM